MVFECTIEVRTKSCLGGGEITFLGIPLFFMLIFDANALFRRVHLFFYY